MSRWLRVFTVSGGVSVSDKDKSALPHSLQDLAGWGVDSHPHLQSTLLCSAASELGLECWQLGCVGNQNMNQDGNFWPWMKRDRATAQHAVGTVSHEKGGESLEIALRKTVWPREPPRPRGSFTNIPRNLGESLQNGAATVDWPFSPGTLRLKVISLGCT